MFYSCIQFIFSYKLKYRYCNISVNGGVPNLFDTLNIDMDKVYPVLVVATMSGGKSTLINALIGDELLPSMNKATTAKAVAILDNDIKDGFEIHAVDKYGKYSNIKKATLDVIEKYNATNELSEMIIEGDIKGVKNSIKALLLIDTPGVNNSADETHGQITHEVLSNYKEGLILYVINAMKRGENDDSNFLSYIADKVNKDKDFNIIFAVNKMGCLDRSKEDPYEFIQDCKRYIENKGIKNPTIIPVCSKGALLFKKVLSGKKLSRFQIVDFSKLYSEFETKDYSMPDYISKPSLGDLSTMVTAAGETYRRSQIYGALYNTGIVQLESAIDTALVSSLKLKAPQVNVKADAKAIINNVEKQTKYTMPSKSEELNKTDFRITVISPMSSGKSTLINAILGQDLLLAYNRSTTTAITEIRCNDHMEHFVLNAKTKYGREVAKNEVASKERIEDLNDMKDPQDDNQKECLVELIQLEGKIPNINSSSLNITLVDTPGGNNLENKKLKEAIIKDIEDENNLILYVFDGTNPISNDYNELLQVISNTIKYSRNSKQSQDRFLFIANKMDDYDCDTEPIDCYVKNEIVPMLNRYGIIDPRLFLVSAEMALRIRKKKARTQKTRKQLARLEAFILKPMIEKFSWEEYMLPVYSSFDSEELIDESKSYLKNAAISEKLGKYDDAEELKMDAAEINSGIPTLEAAINEYLEKYASGFYVDQDKVTVDICYDPDMSKTYISINGEPLLEQSSPLLHEMRIYDWVLPKGKWKGIFGLLIECYGDKPIEINFEGSQDDFFVINHAWKSYATRFNNITLNYIGPAENDSQADEPAFDKEIDNFDLVEGHLKRQIERQNHYQKYKRGKTVKKKQQKLSIPQKPKKGGIKKWLR